MFSKKNGKKNNSKSLNFSFYHSEGNIVYTINKEIRNDKFRIVNKLKIKIKKIREMSSKIYIKYLSNILLNTYIYNISSNHSNSCHVFILSKYNSNNKIK